MRAFPGPSHAVSKFFPLDKYSSALSHEGAQKHHWAHDVRKDLLTLTFKPEDIRIDNGRVETHLFMTVAAGRDILVGLSIVLLGDRS